MSSSVLSLPDYCQVSLPKSIKFKYFDTPTSGRWFGTVILSSARSVAWAEPLLEDGS